METITITKERLKELENDSFFLDCLRWAWVDNWDWYEIAQDDYRENL